MVNRPYGISPNITNIFPVLILHFPIAMMNEIVNINLFQSYSVFWWACFWPRRVIYAKEMRRILRHIGWMRAKATGRFQGKGRAMFCKKCPHHVRHGSLAADSKNIVFKDRCGLKMKSAESQDCSFYPFPKVFDYTECGVYRATFKSVGQRNEAVPVSDFQYAEGLNTQSITEMELL